MFIHINVINLIALKVVYEYHIRYVGHILIFSDSSWLFPSNLNLFYMIYL